MKKIYQFCLTLLFITCSMHGAYAAQFKALLFTKTAGWHHQSILAGVTAMKDLAKANNFAIDWVVNADKFNTKNLAKYDVVIFLSTTGDVLNDKQSNAFKAFIQQGKGFVGIHSASDTEHNWPWYQGLVGRTFIIHPAVQTAKMTVEKSDFPGVEFMPKHFLWTDELYNFSEEHSDKLHYILSVDEKSYSPAAQWGDTKSSGMGSFHPMAWYQYYDGGRSFYTALGHLASTYKNQAFLSHLYGGIFWAATGKGMAKTAQ